MEAEDDAAEENGENELEGAIQALTSTSLTVSGTVVLLTEGTEVEGTLAIGAVVEVEVVVRNGALIAHEVEVKKKAATPPAVTPIASILVTVTVVSTVWNTMSSKGSSIWLDGFPRP